MTKILNQIYTLVLMLIIVVLSGCTQKTDDSNVPSHPNVLFITIDDLTSTHTKEHQIVQTPNIDALGRRGVRFHHAYVQSPICIPSRTSFLSGLRPATTRVYRHEDRFGIADVRELYEPGNFRTLPEHFKENGYFTARVGKIFHAGVPSDIGSDGDDDPYAWVEKYNPAGKDRTAEWCENMVEVNGQDCGGGSLDYYIAPDEDAQHLTDAKVADQVIELLEANKDTAFFIGAGFYLPHPPFIAPKQYFDMYPLEEINLYGGPDYDVKKDRADIPEPALIIDPPFFGISESKRKETRQAYYASVSYVDAQVGRVLKALDDLGLGENTIVVLLGDHGWMLGEHGMYRKHTPFEEAARAPLIISGPGLKKDVVSKTLVEFVNIYPTLLNLCDLPDAPQQLEGYDMSKLLMGNENNWDKPAYSMIKQQIKNKDGNSVKCFGYSVRTHQYRYTEWTMDENSQEFTLGRELYDHDNDPQERHNIAYDNGDQHTELLKKMQDILWQRSAKALSNK